MVRELEGLSSIDRRLKCHLGKTDAIRGLLIEIRVLLTIDWNQPFGRRSAVVLRHSVLPLQELGNALRFNANLYPSQTRQQKVHLVHQPLGGTLALAARLDQHVHRAVVILKQSPAFREIVRADDPTRRQVEAFASKRDVRVRAPRLVSRIEKGRKSLVGVGGFLFVWAVTAPAIATESAAAEVGFGEDHQAVLVVEVFAFSQASLR